MPYYPDDWTTMQRALRAWIVGALGVGWSVIWAEQQGPGATGEGPPPAKPFARMQALDAPSIVGRVDAEAVDAAPTQLDVRTRGLGEFLLEVQTFADTDVRVVERILGAAITPDHDANLRIAGVTPVIDLATRRDLSEVFSGQREFRHVIEIPVRLEVRQTFADQDYFDTVTAQIGVA